MSLKKMDFQDKLDYIDKYSAAFSNGMSVTEAETELRDKYFGKEVNEVILKATRSVSDKIGADVFKAFEAGQTRDQISSGFKADRTIIDHAIDGRLNVVRSSIRKEAQHMLRNGIQLSDAVGRLGHPLFSTQELTRLVGEVEINEGKLDEEVKGKSNTGLILIVVGLALCTASIIIFKDVSLYLIAIVLAGVLMFAKSFFMKK